MIHKEIKSLTGLRGIAAFLVMIHHYNGYHLGDSRFAVFSCHLYLCVDLFFVLSGFVMALNYAHLFETNLTTKSYKYFLVKRFARIYPLYLFTSIVCAILMYFGIMAIKAPGLFGWAVLTNIPLIAAWGIGPYIIDGPAWSISTECGAYLIFPLLCKLVLSGSKYSAIIAVFILYLLLHYMSLLPDSAFNEFHGRGGPLAIIETTTIGPLIRCISEFTLGMIAYRATASVNIMRVVLKPGVAAITGLLIIGLLFGRTTDISIVFLSAFFLVSLSDDKSVVAKFLSSPIPYMLGVVSYSLYLVHVPILIILDGIKLPNVLANISPSHAGLLFVISAAIISLMISLITYRFVEGPSRKIITARLS